MTDQPITVFFWPTPNGHKITIALEEMGLPYEVAPLNIGEGVQFSDDFKRLNPNSKMPAILDPDGPGGEPISVFESGAILQYLGRKTGQFYPADERARVEVDQWLFWQMAGLGPMAGQSNHFNRYAPKIEPNAEKLVYGQERYTRELNRLYAVLNERLADRDFIAGDYSIADMASWPWILPSSQPVDIAQYPNVEAWRVRVGERPGVVAGKGVGKDMRRDLAEDSPEAKRAREVLFGLKPA